MLGLLPEEATELTLQQGLLLLGSCVVAVA